jgi:hypothetical protein
MTTRRISLKRKHLKVILTIMVLLFIGITFFDRYHTKVYSGKYSYGVHFSIFRPENITERSGWHLKFDKGIWSDPLVRSMIDNPEGYGFKDYYIIVEGKLSWPGQYGDLGPNSRELLVTKVLQDHALF